MGMTMLSGDAGETNVMDVMHTLKKCCRCNGRTTGLDKPAVGRLIRRRAAADGNTAVCG